MKLVNVCIDFNLNLGEWFFFILVFFDNNMIVYLYLGFLLRIYYFEGK